MDGSDYRLVSIDGQLLQCLHQVQDTTAVQARCGLLSAVYSVIKTIYTELMSLCLTATVSD